MERYGPSSSAAWPSDNYRPNFNHHFDPYVHYPNHHAGPHFSHPNYPPQPPPPPPHPHPPSHHHHHHHQHNWNRPEFNNYRPEYQHQPHFNNETNEAFGSGGLRTNSSNQNANSGRKRSSHHSDRMVSPDHSGASGHVKLYVAQVPRTGTVDAIRSLFEVHGKIIEIVILRDKLTGQQRGSCFVKYSTSDEADRAIRALDNQYTFPGEMFPINVKYAVGERERLGKDFALGKERGKHCSLIYTRLHDKLYVGNLNKYTTKTEIEEVFSPYGLVEDIFIAPVRDELRHSRGYGFVKYSSGDMALEAIKSLNGITIMRGCDQPLIVRFADPKKPRTGEQSNNNGSGSPKFGPRLQPFRPEPPPGNSMGGCPYPVEQNSASSGPSQIDSRLACHTPSAPDTMQQSFPPLQESLSSFARMSSEPMRTTDQVCQPSQTGFPKMQNQLQCDQPKQDSHQPQSSQVIENMPPHTGPSLQTFSAAPNSPVVPPNSQIETALECDWSEHTCPDGYKYYYNCVTCESLWEKPEEFSLFEKQLKRERLQNSNHQLHPSSAILSSRERLQNSNHQLHPSSAILSSPEVMQQTNLSCQKLEV